MELEKFMVKCVHCETIIESRHIRDYVSCRCGMVAIDGGPFQGASIHGNPSDYIDVSTWKDISRM
jgi:hypothetical protein